MSEQIRTTIYFEPKIHKALQLKAIEEKMSMSTLVNNSMRVTLNEDLEDLATIRERQDEPSIPYKIFLEGLKRDGFL